MRRGATGICEQLADSQTAVMALTCVVVDDSDEFLVAAERLLEGQGVSVVGRTSSSAEAIGLAAALRPDVVLVDVELGEEDGVALATELATTHPEMAVILISVRDRGELVELTAASHVAGFLRKNAISAAAISDLMSGRG
jgi:two-component system, NarL family, nitrate/nitrite response regulator NarL